MTKDRQIKLLKQVINDTFWMARRYAHGRHTYAPFMVREAYFVLCEHFPDLIPEKDVAINPPDPIHYTSKIHMSEWLDDINLEKKQNG